MKILCVIPARYASTRLPGKPLKDVAGKPMICRVYDRASQAKTLSGVVVATDDERILRAVEDHGGRAMMTAKDHPTGTDRLAEVAEAYPDVDLIINGGAGGFEYSTVVYCVDGDQEIIRQGKGILDD